MGSMCAGCASGRRTSWTRARPSTSSSRGTRNQRRRPLSPTRSARRPRLPAPPRGLDCMPQRPTILLIEDNATVADLYSVVLEHGAFEVLKATRGETGIDLAVAEQPDAI